MSDFDVGSDRSPQDMDHEELADEWEGLFTEYVEGPPSDATEDAIMFERLQFLWSEMERRVEPDYPECPQCYATESWGQSPGEPKECTTCGYILRDGDEMLAEEIDAAWQAVVAGGASE